MHIPGLEFLKQLGVLLAATLLGAALLQRIVAESALTGSALGGALLLVSPLAYLLREACRNKPARQASRRATERTRVGDWRPGEE